MPVVCQLHAELLAVPRSEVGPSKGSAMQDLGWRKVWAKVWVTAVEGELVRDRITSGQRLCQGVAHLTAAGIDTRPDKGKPVWFIHDTHTTQLWLRRQ